LKVFFISFLKKKKKQLKKTSYLTSSIIRAIRRKIIKTILQITAHYTLKNLVGKFLSEKLTSEIEKECKRISPIYNFFVRKVKILKEKN